MKNYGGAGKEGVGFISINLKTVLNMHQYYFFITIYVCFSGQYGGMRAAMQLRALLGELGCISVSNILGIPDVKKALDENGKTCEKVLIGYVSVWCQIV